jgi:urea transport system permease protein
MPGGSGRTTLRFVLIGAVLVLAALPALNRLPVENALHVSDFIVSIAGKWITYAILALAIDLAWGYAGILSLGHGAFFALGGYAIGMHLMRLIGPRGVYGHPVLPDFMVFLGYKELPWYWLGFDHFPFAILMAMLVPGVLAGVVGYLAFRSRITGVYLSIITQALTYALMLAFFRNDMGFGGNNGFTDFKELLGMPLNTAAARSALFYASLLLLLGALWICSRITRSKLGRVLVAIRDAESRARFLGYDVTRHKLFVFVLSAMIAGLAGALYVPQVGIINPGEFSPGNSIEAVIWVAVGGRGTLVGALLGAFSVNALKTWLTTVAPDLWLFVLGGLFVAVTLFLPRGLIGLFSRAQR